jgi:hypothetical protein
MIQGTRPSNSRHRADSRQRPSGPSPYRR